MSFETSDKRKPWKKFGAERIEGQDSPADVWILAGLFTDCKESYGFLDTFRDEVQGEERPVILDLSAVDHITSCGAGILGACYCSATNAGKKLCLVGVSERALAMLKVIGLAKVIDIYPSRQEAFDSMN